MQTVVDVNGRCGRIAGRGYVWLTLFQSMKIYSHTFYWRPYVFFYYSTRLVRSVLYAPEPQTLCRVLIIFSARRPHFAAIFNNSLREGSSCSGEISAVQIFVRIVSHVLACALTTGTLETPRAIGCRGHRLIALLMLGLLSLL